MFPAPRARLNGPDYGLDFVTVVGRVPAATASGVAGGYSGHGNVLGFASGRHVARAILADRDPLLDLFEPARLLG